MGDKKEEIKQLLDLICEEVNVKNIVFANYIPKVKYNCQSRKFELCQILKKSVKK